MTWCAFHVERRAMGQIVAPPWMDCSRLCCQDGGRSRPWVVTGWFHLVWRRTVVVRKKESDRGGGGGGKGFVTRINSNV